jgi:nucleoside-diphosphate-sugar epimerase
MNKSLLVTGAAGFIGRHIAQEALRRGYRVTGVDRVQSHVEGMEFIKADIRDKDRMMQCVRGQDRVIHLAAITSNVEFIRNFRDCYDTNATGFLNVLDAAARNGCRRLVYASSAAVYIDGFSEDTIIDLRKQGNHYAKTKIMNEMIARSYSDTQEMNITGLRYFNVYGSGENAKGDYASIMTIFLRARRRGEPLVVYGDGRQARDLINVADATQVTLELLERGSDHVYNVGTGVATAYTTIAEMIDRNAICYVPNPLTSYQYYTRAETTRLRAVLGDYEFTGLAKGMKAMAERWQADEVA